MHSILNVYKIDALIWFFCLLFYSLDNAFSFCGHNGTFLNSLPHRDTYSNTQPCHRVGPILPLSLSETKLLEPKWKTAQSTLTGALTANYVYCSTVKSKTFERIRGNKAKRIMQQNHISVLLETNALLHMLEKQILKLAQTLWRQEKEYIHQRRIWKPRVNDYSYYYFSLETNWGCIWLSISWIAHLPATSQVHNAYKWNNELWWEYMCVAHGTHTYYDSVD